MPKDSHHWYSYLPGTMKQHATSKPMTVAWYIRPKYGCLHWEKKYIFILYISSLHLTFDAFLYLATRVFPKRIKHTWIKKNNDEQSSLIQLLSWHHDAAGISYTKDGISGLREHTFTQKTFLHPSHVESPRFNPLLYIYKWCNHSPDDEFSQIHLRLVHTEFVSIIT